MKEVNRVAKELKSRLERLDLVSLRRLILTGFASLLRNLTNRIPLLTKFYGIAGKGVNAFSLTPEGLDSHLALNNLSHHVLLSHLFPLLVRTSKLPNSDVRIVQMSSEFHRLPKMGGPEVFDGKFASVEEFKKDVGQAGLYARTKECVLLFTKVSFYPFSFL